MKKTIILATLVLSANAFSGCLENFKYVVDHNKANLAEKEQILVHGSELQQELIMMRAKLYDLTVTRKIDNKTKKLISHQERMIRLMEGQADQNDINYISKKMKLTKELVEMKVSSALLKENSFCLSSAGDLSDDVENYNKLSRNTTEITAGEIVDPEHMGRAIVPKTEDEVIRMLRKL